MRQPFILAIASAGIIFALGCQPSAPSAKDLSSVLAGYHYTALEPPSTLTPPGAIVSVQNANPLVLGLVCDCDSALAHEAPISTSDSASSNVAQSLTGSFDLGVDLVNRVNLDVGGNFVQSITISLSNVKLIEIPDTSVVHYSSDRSADCKTAIQRDRAQGEQLTMIKSALQADAAYNITYTNGVTTAIKAQIGPQLAVSLNASIGSSGSGQLTGTALFWGLRDNEALIDWGNAPEHIEAPQPAPIHSILKPGAIISKTFKEGNRH